MCWINEHNVVQRIFTHFWETVFSCWGVLFWRTLYLMCSNHRRQFVTQTRRMAIANGTCVSFCNQPKAHFGLPWIRPWDNRSKCYMDGKRIQCWSKRSSIYQSIFNRLRAIARYWSEIATFSYPLAFIAPVGRYCHWNFGKKFGSRKIRIMGLPGSEDSLTIDWAVSIQYQRVTDGQTDGQTSSLYQ